MTKTYALIVYVPLSHSDAVRMAIGDAGGGKIGNYSHCSFSVRGTGRFKGNNNSNPAFGQAGQYESVEEERIEIPLVSEQVVHQVIAAMKAAHPYEEVAYQLIELANPSS